MTVAEVTCLCGKARGVVNLAGSIPLPSILCHATSCRHNLGALAHSALPLLDRPDSIELLKAFVVDLNLKRYFCDICGSHMFEHEKSCWRVQSGVVNRIHNEQVFKALEEVVGHDHVADTLDGGLYNCFKDADTPSAERPLQEEPVVTGSIRISSDDRPLEEDKRNASKQLDAACICGGVSFKITRPDDMSQLCASQWPDLIVPFCDYSRSPVNPEDTKWWICDDKWLAGTCACKSCRLGLGFPIQAWAFVSLRNIVLANGHRFTYNTGTLKSYESSKGALREFCRNCGATVFWHNGERPGVVDVSVGLLRNSDGALTRSWLNWHTQRVSFEEEAFDKVLVARVKAGLERLRAA